MSIIRTAERSPTRSARIAETALLKYKGGHIAEAIYLARKAVKLDPQSFDALRFLGYFLTEAGQPLEAIAAYSNALELNPDHSETRFNRAKAKLMLGDYRGGFLDYEARIKHRAENYDSRLKRWDGSSTNHRVMLQCEQGFGDVIQFCRYFNIVRERCPNLIIWNGKTALNRLLARNFANVSDQLFSYRDIDGYVPSMSLPLVLNLMPDGHVPAVPYLSADRNLAARWASDLPPSKLPKIGLVWRGNAQNTRDSVRSIPARSLDALNDVPAAFYSLQYPPQDQQPGFVIDLGARIADFEDTAAIIANLDLVITVDTAVAHLAGALGKPVWILLSTALEWRWLVNRDDSPWYPTARIFRQTKAGEWGPVLNQVCDALKRL